MLKIIAALCAIFVAGFVLIFFIGAFEDDYDFEVIPAPEITAPPAGQWNQPLPAPLATQLSQAIKTWRATEGVDGLSLALSSARLGQWHADEHLKTPPTYWWASTGKLATTMLTLRAIEDGKLNFGTPLSDLIPNAPADITILHLLTHTSGLGSFTELEWAREHSGLMDRAQLLSKILDMEPLFDAGDGWSYSNSGYWLLAHILEKTHGQSFAQLVQEQIATPLGLNSFAALDGTLPAHVVYPDLGDPMPALDYAPNIFGAGGIVASAPDMVRFWHEVMAGELVDLGLLNAGQKLAHPFLEIKPCSWALGSSPISARLNSAMP